MSGTTLCILIAELFFELIKANSVLQFASKASLTKGFCWVDNFENEALDDEDRSTKHPNLENEAPKKKLENEDP